MGKVEADGGGRTREDSASDESDVDAAVLSRELGDGKLPLSSGTRWWGELDSESGDSVGDDVDTDTEGHVPVNAVGKIPMWWYDSFPHRGYSRDGTKLTKDGENERDSVARHVESKNPDDWRTVFDEVDGKSVVLTDQEVEMIRRWQSGFAADARVSVDDGGSYVPPRPVYQHALTGRLPPKQSFIPSRHEARLVMRIVREMRKADAEGRPYDVHGARLDELKKKRLMPFDLWSTSGANADRDLPEASRLPAPKMRLPTHSESFNPPEEFLPSEKEIAEWNELDPEDRPLDYLPKSFPVLHNVPAYGRLLRERFERCLDLYLCPRVVPKKSIAAGGDLLPELPDPNQLRPFPSEIAVRFVGHRGPINSVSLSATGQWLASGGADGTLRVWETASGRCLRVLRLGSKKLVDVDVRKVEESIAEDNIELERTEVGVGVSSVAWRSVAGPAGDLLAVAVGETVYVLAIGLSSDEDQPVVRSILQSGGAVREFEFGGVRSVCLEFEHSTAVRMISWHRKGDYLAVVCSGTASNALVIHQLSSGKSQRPFRSLAGHVRAVEFHRGKPFLFVALERTIRVYNLANMSMIKSLKPGVGSISDIAVHPSGDHVLVGSTERRVAWMDLDLGSTPYKTLRLHRGLVSSVAFHSLSHSGVPLFASASHDGTIQVLHGRTYSDFSENAVIVPLTILRGHRRESDAGRGVLALEFHPVQPWLVSAGADGRLVLWS